MASDNSPTVETPAVPTLESALAEFAAAVPAAPEPTLESLLAEFSRGVGSDESARRAADLIRERDAPPSDPAAPPADPEASPVAETDPAEPPQPEIVYPDFAPDWLSPDKIKAQIAATQQQEQQERFSEAFDKLQTEGIPAARVKEKLAGILLTDAGERAFLNGGKAWNGIVAQAQADIAAEADAIAQRHGAAILSDQMAARAAVKNSGHAPMPEEKYDPVAVSRMSDRQYAAYIENKYPNVRRR